MCCCAVVIWLFDDNNLNKTLKNFVAFPNTHTNNPRIDRDRHIENRRSDKRSVDRSGLAVGKQRLTYFSVVNFFLVAIVPTKLCVEGLHIA